MAHYSQRHIHKESIEDAEAFWGKEAQSIKWTKPPRKTLETTKDGKWRWFPGGEMNMCYDAIDRNVEKGLGPVPAIIWDSPVTGGKDVITYSDLLLRVQLFAGVLKSLGVKKGMPLSSLGVNFEKGKQPFCSLFFISINEING